MEEFIVILKPGQKVVVQFYESDGQIDVEFSRSAIKVKTDWADQKGRKGVIYNEQFYNPPKEVCLKEMKG